MARAPFGLVVLVALAGSECLAHKASSPPMELAVTEGAFTDLPQGDPRRNASFERAAELGATHIRAFFPWVKSANGTYDDSYVYFPRWDSFVDEANQRGFEVQLSITGSWGPDQTKVDPDPADYARFLTCCAKHFLGRVHRYSVWNEPNQPLFLSPATPSRPQKSFTDAINIAMNKTQHAGQFHDVILPKNAQRYSELAVAGYAAIKAVDPSAQVLIGEVSSSHEAFDFIELMAPPGRHLVADGFAFHPYQFTTAPDAGSGEGISRLGHLKALLAKLAREKRLTTPSGAPLPLYLTEFGYQKREGRTFTITQNGHKVAPPTEVSEETRAKWLPIAYQKALDVGAKQMLYFQLMPTPPAYNWDTSLCDASYAPLPSFLALKAWAAAHGYPTIGAVTTTVNPAPAPAGASGALPVPAVKKHAARPR